jgi:hypothetical protein
MLDQLISQLGSTSKMGGIKVRTDQESDTVGRITRETAKKIEVRMKELKMTDSLLELKCGFGMGEFFHVRKSKRVVTVEQVGKLEKLLKPDFELDFIVD